MATKAKKPALLPEHRLSAQRGSLIACKQKLRGKSELAVVVSNDVQNNNSEFLLVAPLERRKARLRAPFAVDLGRGEGLRDLHCLRCDWITSISQSDVVSIEKACLSAAALVQLDNALCATLALSQANNSNKVIGARGSC